MILLKFLIESLNNGIKYVVEEWVKILNKKSLEMLIKVVENNNGAHKGKNKFWCTMN